jgi:hypothetical protein
MSTRMSHTSPDRDVTEEVLSLSRPPYAMHTPPRERKARRAAAHNANPLQARQWCGPVHNGPDRSPWHASKIIPILQGALKPGATVETLLRGTNSLFLCASETEENRCILREMQSLPALVAFLYDRTDTSHSGARVKEHLVNTLTVLLGDENPAFNNHVAFDDQILPRVLPAALADKHAVVVLAAARFLRRLSEVTKPHDAARQIVLNETLFDALLHRHETCEEMTIRTHLLCALVNVSTDESTHFLLARCQRLLQLLLDEVFSGGAISAQINANKWEASFNAAPTLSATSPRPGTPSAAASKTPSRSVSAAAGAFGASSASPTVKKLRPGLVDVSPLHRYVVTPRSARRSQARESVSLLSPGRTSASMATSVRPAGGFGNDLASTDAAGATVLDPHVASALDLCELALKLFDNVLSDDTQCAEIKRLAPTLVHAVIDCRSSPSDGVVAAATAVLRKLHDLDGDALEREVSYGILQGRATSQRLRSRVSDSFIAQGLPTDMAFEDDDGALLSLDAAEATLGSGSYSSPLPQLALPAPVGPRTASIITSTAPTKLTDVEGGSTRADDRSTLVGGTDSKAGSIFSSAVDLVRHLLGS